MGSSQQRLAKEKAMKVFPILAMSGMLMLSNIAFAQEALKAQQEKEIKPAPAPKTLKIKPLRTNCYTSDSDCAGVAYFQNSDARRVGCTIWFNNGSAGRSNWQYGPKETHTIQVRYGDTFSCVWAEQAPPAESVARSWIYVR